MRRERLLRLQQIDNRFEFVEVFALFLDPPEVLLELGR